MTQQVVDVQRGTGPGRMGRARISPQTVIAIAILTILAILTLLPVLVMIELSLKDAYQFNVQRWLPSFPWHFENYVLAWYQASPYLWNSLVIATVTTAISITASSLTAYVMARYAFPGRTFLYFAIISLLMIPGILTLISTFLVVLKLNLINTYFGLWFPLAAGAQAFQIFVLRTFFASLPQELFECAQIDGAGKLRMLWAIALPLSRPIFVTLVVLQFLNVWNEYIWPIMVLQDNTLQPITVALLQFKSIWPNVTLWGPLFAGYTLAALPLFLLFAFTGRQFIRGLTSGALKI